MHVASRVSEFKNNDQKIELPTPRFKEINPNNQTSWKTCQDQVHRGNRSSRIRKFKQMSLKTFGCDIAHEY